MVERPEFERVISVLTFYICSCTCLHRVRRRSTSSGQTPSHVLWKEEIENGPSLLHRSTERVSTSASSAPSHQMPSTAEGDGYVAVEPLSMLGEKEGKQSRITQVAITELPRIHPPVNDRHPPVVSALPGRTETSWMTLPPPTASSMKSLNRQINLQRNLSWDHTTRSSRSGSGSGASLDSGARPGSQDTGRFQTPQLPLQVENMLGENTSKPRLARRVRYQENVLEDMEAPPSTRGTDSTGPKTRSRGTSRASVWSRPTIETTTKSGPVTAGTTLSSPLKGNGNNQPLSPRETMSEKENWNPTADEQPVISHIEMVQVPQQAALRPLSISGLGVDRFSHDLERELSATNVAVR